MKIKRFLHNNWFWAGLWFAQIVLFFVLSKVPVVVDFVQKLFGKTQYFRTGLFRNWSFSVGDLFYSLIILFLIYQLALLLKKRHRKMAARRLLVLLNVMYFVYQLSWGLLYFETPLFPTKEMDHPLPIPELKYLAKVYLKKSDSTRNLLPEPVFKIKSLPAVKQEILEKQKENALKFKDEGHIQISLKPSLFKKWMNYSGISGYYNPFTSEAQYDADLPDTFIPFTLAHETSHQIGFAREEEADYIAFLVGKDSKNPDLRYSTDWFVFKSLLVHIFPKDSMFVKNTIKNLPQNMRRDFLAEKRFRIDHRGLVEKFFYHSNDLFLKSNQQAGIKSYNYFVYLLLQYEKKKGLRFTTQSQKHK